MKKNFFDIFFGGLLYALPMVLMLIPVAISVRENPDLFVICLSLISAFLCFGMSLMRINYLEEEIKCLKDALNKKKAEK